MQPDSAKRNNYINQSHKLNALFQDPSLTRRPKFCIAGMTLGFGKNSKKFYVSSNNYIFITLIPAHNAVITPRYQHNQQSHISYDAIPNRASILPNTASILPCMHDLGCPSDYTVDNLTYM